MAGAVYYRLPAALSTPTSFRRCTGGLRFDDISQGVATSGGTKVALQSFDPLGFALLPTRDIPRS